jgi:biotin transport system substrate-specific component
MQTLTANTSRYTGLSAFAATIPGKVVIGLGATAVVAAAAHVAIPLPFTPVPLTLQPLAVLGVGLALGPVAGFMTMLAYLAEGALGLPVFSPTGLGGTAQLFGPTGGFLMAYPLVAAVAGGVARSLKTRIPAFGAALTGGSFATVLLFLCGAAWLMNWAHLSLAATWHAAVWPFLAFEAVKVVIAAGIYSTLMKATRIE